MAWNLIPAAIRVYHATENHFQYPHISTFFKERLQSVLNVADAVICCSDGVRNTYENYAPKNVVTVSNGCEFDVYASGEIYPALERKSKSYEKTVVYAGNIDDRLNYSALLEVTETKPNYFFAFFGQVNILESANRQCWKKIKDSKNVDFFGYISPEELPNVYKTADVGVLPYCAMPLLKKNTLPLKAFEMLASGLPVVATNLDMLLPYRCKGVYVGEGNNEFITGIEQTGRHVLSEDESLEILNFSKLQDYDKKFSIVLELVSGILNQEGELTSPYKDKMGMVLAKNARLNMSVSKKFRLLDAILGPLLRLAVKIFRPFLLYLYRNIWPKLPDGIRFKMRNVLYNFVTKILKL